MKKEVLLFPEEYWRNSQLSTVRHFGSCRIGEQEFVIVDKLGRDIFECSAIAEREGRDKAIEAGEPADLIDVRLQQAYRRLGRDRIIGLLKVGKTLRDINRIAKGHEDTTEDRSGQPGHKP